MNQDTLPETLPPEARSALADLENRVQARLSGLVRNLRLLLHDRGFVLRGFACTDRAKQLAQHVVATETQLPILANEIEVVEPIHRRTRQQRSQGCSTTSNNVQGR